MHAFLGVLLFALLQYHEGPVSCSVPILDSNGVRGADGSTIHVAPSKKYTETPANGTASIDVGGSFHRDYELSGEFTLPAVPTNRGLFYTDWILLKQYKGDAFVQVELMRWKKYGFRDEIGLTWSLPDGRLIYRDTEVFLDDSPHQLAIGEKNGVIHFTVDHRQICAMKRSAFFPQTAHLFYQIGTETVRYGDHPSGDMYDLFYRTDNDRTARPIPVTCIYRGYGISIKAMGNGRYRADGVFDPTEPYIRFTGLRYDQPCNIASQ